MKTKDRIMISFAKILPSAYRKNLSQLFVYAGKRTNPEVWVGSSVVISLILFIVLVVTPYFLTRTFDIKYILIAFGVVITVQMMAYLMVYFRVEDRTKKVEEALPDALQLISANLRAGMTPFEALKLSARDEFGPLKEEIEFATAKAFGTESFTKALLNMSKHIKSEMLERAMKLFTTAMRSGGHTAQLLEELSKDIAETRTLKKELVTNTKTYSMFIMFTIVIGTPLLLAIAIHFLKMVTAIQAKTGRSTVGFGLDFLAGQITISPEFLTKLSMVILFITSLLACMLMGVISEGKAKHGLRFAPFVIGASIIVFFIARQMIGSIIGGL
ncbi:hypothetical protein D6745_03910 [Candidatus Woesearchaeota archaeon]|nr:MAG: hypothetical protein D6745_03910 [Candidatus Woesearchaeota archaeon]